MIYEQFLNEANAAVKALRKDPNLMKKLKQQYHSLSQELSNPNLTKKKRKYLTKMLNRTTNTAGYLNKSHYAKAYGKTASQYWGKSKQFPVGSNEHGTALGSALLNHLEGDSTKQAARKIIRNTRSIKVNP